MTSKHVAKILGLKQQANQKGQTSISHKVGQSLMSVSFLEIYGNINITLKQKKTSSFIIINNTSLVFHFGSTELSTFPSGGKLSPKTSVLQ